MYIIIIFIILILIITFLSLRNIEHLDNIGYDFGGWSDALLTNNLYENYDNFIFANSSVIGPFLPDYCKGKWSYKIINILPCISISIKS